VVAETKLANLKAQCPDRLYHFWQGRSELWKELIPAPLAERIAAAHSASFTQLGYICDADPALTMAQAETNWRKLLGLPVDLDPTRATLQQALDEVKWELAQTRARLAVLGHVGPLTLSLAQRVHHWSVRFPRLAGAIKKMLPRPHRFWSAGEGRR
jgi:hypothetical protein